MKAKVKRQKSEKKETTEANDRDQQFEAAKDRPLAASHHLLDITHGVVQTFIVILSPSGFC
jgi:hypothetical protein